MMGIPQMQRSPICGLHLLLTPLGASPALEGFFPRLLERRGTLHAELVLCHTVGTACNDASSYSLLRVDAICVTLV